MRMHRLNSRLVMIRKEGTFISTELPLSPLTSLRDAMITRNGREGERKKTCECVCGTAVS